jgi:hypothetical protein
VSPPFPRLQDTADTEENVEMASYDGFDMSHMIIPMTDEEELNASHAPLPSHSELTSIPTASLLYHMSSQMDSSEISDNWSDQVLRPESADTTDLSEDSQFDSSNQYSIESAHSHSHMELSRDSTDVPSDTVHRSLTYPVSVSNTSVSTLLAKAARLRHSMERPGGPYSRSKSSVPNSGKFYLKSSDRHHLHSSDPIFMPSATQDGSTSMESSKGSRRKSSGGHKNNKKQQQWTFVAENPENMQR